MWNPFKKKSSIRPNFKFFEQYPDRKKYPVRIQKWDWLNQKQIFIPLKDKEGNLSMNTLDFWLQQIFLDSLGDKDIEEIFKEMQNQYLESKMQIPKELDLILIDTIKTLTKELKYIELHEKPVSLKNDVLLPISEQSE